MSATHYVACVIKNAKATEPHKIVQAIGTSGDAARSKCTRRWTVSQAIAAIRRGDVFLCRDTHGDQARLVVAERAGHEYLTSETDGRNPQ